MIDSALSANPSAKQADPLYEEALQYLQQGNWAESSARFQTLMGRYPDWNELKSLFEYAHLKASIDQRDLRVQSSLLTTLNRFLTRRRKLMVLFVAVFAVWLVFFNRYIKPVNELSGSLARQEQHLSQARLALANKDYAAAQHEFEAVLAEDPVQPEAKAGVEEARAMAELQARYAQAEALQQNGQWEQSMVILQEIAVTSPGYKNVDELIQRAVRAGGIAQRFQAAEDYYKAAEWQLAVQEYEAVRSLDLRYQQGVVNDHLYTAYLKLGEATIAAAASPNAVETGLTLFQQALSLKPRDPSATTSRDQAQVFLSGRGLYEQGDWRGAIGLWRPLYDRVADYAHGELAGGLYNAYLESGAAYQRERDYLAAFRDYSAAAAMPVADVATARQRMQAVGLLLTPTPTATATPTSTPTPTATPLPAVAPPPIPPTKLSSPRLKGMIVFRSNRDDTSGLYAMRPDGTHILEVVDESATFEVIGANGDNLTLDYHQVGFEGLESLDTWTPDRRLRVYVEGDRTKAVTAIYLWHYDRPQNWNNVRTQVLDNTAINYGPVITPDGSVIVFVSQKTGNDEIWRVNADGSDLRQLTKNTWEWDKHPTLSPDGKLIAFWSNRGTSGKGQIWIMDLDGNNLHNISSNSNYDWDPVWVK